MRSRKFIPAKFLKGTIRESLYPQKLILALGDRESLSPESFYPRKFIPIKYIFDYMKYMNLILKTRITQAHVRVM